MKDKADMTSMPPSTMPRFGREFTQAEWDGYKQIIRKGKDALGVKHLGLIAPVRSLPTASNTGIGSLPGAKDFFQFVANLGFDTVQIDPEGKTTLENASPYNGTVFSTSPLNIDLKALVSEPAWGGLLSQKTFDAIEAGNPYPDGSTVAYKYIFNAQENALKEAWKNFQSQRSGSPSAEIKELSKRFDAFVKSNQSWLEPDSLYEALSEEYGNDYWKNWSGPNAELDKNLYNAAEPAAAKARIAELKTTHADTVGAYQFAQFVAAEQKKSFRSFTADQQLAVMADRQVGFSDRDVWAYQKLFLKDWSMGCPPDYFAKGGQAWGFPVLDPEQLFTKTGSLGEGGVLLKKLFEKIFEENPGGVRIDHIVGLIDPWVYPAGAATTKDGGRLYGSPENGYLKGYSFVSEDQLNTVRKQDGKEDEPITKDDTDRVNEDALDKATIDKYAQVLDKIVLAAAREKGVDASNVICEDLGTLTNPVVAVMKARNLSGIRVTQFVDPKQDDHMYRGKNVDPQHWVTPGTHDNEPIVVWGQKTQSSDQAQLHADNLAADLEPDDAARPGLVQRLLSDPLALVKAKFAELFASPAHQKLIFFADLFGLDESYNRPGTTGEGNWSMRIPKDFQKVYFDSLKANRGLNLPAVILDALHAKGVKDPALDKELKRYADIIKE